MIVHYEAIFEKIPSTSKRNTKMFDEVYEKESQQVALSLEKEKERRLSPSVDGTLDGIQLEFKLNAISNLQNFTKMTKKCQSMN